MPLPSCTPYDFQLDPLPLAATVTADRSVFHDSDGDGCPAACAEKAYVVKGDALLVATHDGAPVTAGAAHDYVCAVFSAGPHATAGWLLAKELSVAAPGTSADVRGDWLFTDEWLSVRPEAADLWITGEAFWHGLGDNIHIGELDGLLEADGTGFKTQGDGCEARFARVGSYLLATDNNECGGANVTFAGVYAHLPTAPPAGDYADGTLRVGLDGDALTAFARITGYSEDRPQCTLAMSGKFIDQRAVVKVFAQDGSNGRGRFVFDHAGARLVLDAVPAGCKALETELTGYGTTFGRGAAQPWIAVRTVSAVKAPFRTAPGAAPGKAYIVAGDVVAIDRVDGDYAHATYTNAKGKATVGWLATADLDPLP